jgi:hypothetical protein
MFLIWVVEFHQVEKFKRKSLTEYAEPGSFTGLLEIIFAIEKFLKKM